MSDRARSEIGSVMARLLAPFTKRDRMDGPIPPVQVAPSPHVVDDARTAQHLAELAAIVHAFMLEQIGTQECLFRALGQQPGLYHERLKSDFLAAAEKRWPLGEAEMPKRVAALMRQFEAGVAELRKVKR